MSSLVANYSDSESEKEDNDDSNVSKKSNFFTAEFSDEDDGENKVAKQKADGINPIVGQNLLAAEFLESDDDDDDDEDETLDDHENETPQTKMPLPAFGSSVREGGDIPSVFQNPFQKAEDQRKAILEQHVKMTASLQEKEGEKRRRLPCFKFRKGQCHAGDKCRFFHDKTTVSRREKGGDGEQKQQAVYAAAPKLLQPEPQFDFPEDTSRRKGGPGGAPVLASFFDPVRDAALVDDADGRPRKKRVGMSAGLVPPKKAMTNLNEMRAKERPWTVDGSDAP